MLSMQLSDRHARIALFDIFLFDGVGLSTLSDKRSLTTKINKREKGE